MRFSYGFNIRSRVMKAISSLLTDRNNFTMIDVDDFEIYTTEK